VLTHGPFLEDGVFDDRILFINVVTFYAPIDAAQGFFAGFVLVLGSVVP
jgi:hypothetical protein